MPSGIEANMSWRAGWAPLFLHTPPLQSPLELHFLSGSQGGMKGGDSTIGDGAGVDGGAEGGHGPSVLHSQPYSAAQTVLSLNAVWMKSLLQEERAVATCSVQIRGGQNA